MTTHDGGVPAQPIGNELPLPSDIVTAASPWIRLGAVDSRIALGQLVTLGIGWVIWALAIVGRGQTPAKALLNLRVIDTGSLKPVGFARMFWVRELVAGIVAWLCDPLDSSGCCCFMPFWDRRYQNRSWDKMPEHIRGARPKRSHGAPSPTSPASQQTRQTPRALGAQVGIKSDCSSRWKLRLSASPPFTDGNAV